MTIASEITRLQGAKSDIRQAIIDKGVDVGANLTLDEYAACILEIESIKSYYLDILVVGGGGGEINGEIGSYYIWGSGGGGGGVITQTIKIKETQAQASYDIIVGKGGNDRRSGCPSCAFGLIANGGCSTTAYNCPGGTSGNGCIGGAFLNTGNRFTSKGGGGGGAGGNGYDATSDSGGNGGVGICSDISGTMLQYGGGGGGSCGGCVGAANYGCGGSGNTGICAGCQGVVILRYKTDGSCGICNTSTGGTKYTCGDYTIHCFTNTSTTERFIPVYK